MISVRGLIQPIAPSMMSTRPDLVDSISAAHSIWCGTIFRPSRSAMSESISPSVPISLPSLMVVIGMSPFIATLSTPGSIVLIAPLAAGAAVPATAGAAVAAVDTVVAAAAAGAEVGAAAAGALVGAAAAGALVGAAAAGAEVGAAAGAELQALSSDPAAAVPASASVSRRNCRRETRVVWAAFDTSMLLLPPRSIGKGTSGVQRSLLRRQRQPRPDHRSARPASSGHSVRLSCPSGIPLPLRYLGYAWPVSQRSRPGPPCWLDARHPQPYIRPKWFSHFSRGGGNGQPRSAPVGWLARSVRPGRPRLHVRARGGAEHGPPRRWLAAPRRPPRPRARTGALLWCQPPHCPPGAVGAGAHGDPRDSAWPQRRHSRAG